MATAQTSSEWLGRLGGLEAGEASEPVAVGEDDRAGGQDCKRPSLGVLDGAGLREVSGDVLPASLKHAASERAVLDDCAKNLAVERGGARRTTICHYCSRSRRGRSSGGRIGSQNDPRGCG